MNEVLNDYVDLGLSVIPIGKNKKPFFSQLPRDPTTQERVWEPYQERFPTEEELKKWDFPAAIIGGKISGGLVCLDFDDKGSCFELFKILITSKIQGLFEKFTIQQTPSGGYHLIYRVPDVVINSDKIANKEERDKDGKIELIEIKSEGGYFIASPSAGYRMIQNGFDNIPIISQDHNDFIIECAKSFDRSGLRQENATFKKANLDDWVISPFDDYDKKNTPIKDLEKAGWKVVYEKGEVVYLQRPDKKDDGISATWNHVPDRFYVFSTNAVGFSVGKSYRASWVYAVLYCGGDYKKAAKELFKGGYGTLKESCPFEILGFSNPPHMIHYRRKTDCELFSISFTSHDLRSLLEIAPLTYWNNFCIGNGLEKANALFIQDYLSSEATKKGRFYVENTRGYGAYFDNGRPVYNDGVTISGVPIKDFKSKYFYRVDNRITDDCPAIPQPDIKKVFALMGFTEGEKIIFGGWCALAPICGVLPWRPHIWILAHHGSGKTKILNMIVYPLIGKCEYYESGTTEAGIRQDLKDNSYSIIYDEAEARTKKTDDIMVRVLELARKASGNQIGKTGKGTQNGKGIDFRTSTMFCFASINTASLDSADESRISVLNYEKLDEEGWGKLQNEIIKQLTLENCSSLRNHIIKNMGNVLKSIIISREAITDTVEISRFADQYSPFIAGWWHIDRSEVIDKENAVKLRDIMFSGKNSERVTQNVILEHEQCLDEIFTIGLAVGAGKMESIRSVVLRRTRPIGDNDADDAKKILNSYGISVSDDKEFVLIHEKNTEFRRLLEKTHYRSGIKNVIGRLPGVCVGYSTCINGKSVKTVKIPVSLIIEED